MHLVRFAGLDNEADRGAQALADQVMMDRAGREQRRDGDAIRPDVAVGQDDDVAPCSTRSPPGAQPVQRRSMPAAPSRRR